jgi:GNAT superfamily N-acetyltransferase
MHIETIATPTQIAACFRALKELRPHLTSPEALVAQVERQMQAGYQLAGIRGADDYVSAVGYRLLEFLAWGKVLYVDDLITLPEARGSGYGGQLLDYVKEQAIRQQCDAVHLDTGYARHAAHKLYLSKGYELNCHHLALKLEGDGG